MKEGMTNPFFILNGEYDKLMANEIDLYLAALCKYTHLTDRTQVFTLHVLIRSFFAGVMTKDGVELPRFVTSVVQNEMT